MRIDSKAFRAVLLAIGTAALSACGEVASDTDEHSLALDNQLQAAQAQLVAGNVSEARAAFSAVLESDPSSAEARLGLADSARRDGDTAAAQQSLEEVLGLGADRDTLTRALSGLADLRRAAGDEASAKSFDAQAASLRAEAPTP